MNMKKILLSLSILMLCTSPLQARTFFGQGVAPSSDEAKKEALADLSQNLHVEVVSEFTSVVTQSGSQANALKTKHIDISSRLPLLGVQMTVQPDKTDYKADARLTPRTLPLYETELAAVLEKINQTLTKTDHATTHAEQKALLQDILTRIDRFERLRLIARLLGTQQAFALAVTEAEVKARIWRLEKKADTLDDGLKPMAEKISKSGIYIFPPTTGLSREITPFASAVKDHLAMHLATCPDLASADYIMTGGYRILSDGIELTYRVMDREQNTIQTIMGWFLPRAYQGYRITPATLDFERLVASGIVVTSDFKVDLKTTDGRSDLLYKKGDRIILLMKMNRPGYFYIMSHAFKNQAYSYLIHLNDTPGNRKFISYIGPDEAGKWIELGEFEAAPPFGVETLHVFAATEDLENRVPKTFLDPDTHLYKVGASPQTEASPSNAVVATRGLMIKRKKQSVHAETSLTITIMETTH